MARRRVVVRETSDVFSVRLPWAGNTDADWQTKTVARSGACFDQERRLWNGRGYETRVERGVVTEYETDGYVPYGAERVS